jgi:DNA-binding HxlR family transcriptional regulator
VENFSNILRSTTEISVGSRVHPELIALDAAPEQEKHFDQNIRQGRRHDVRIFRASRPLERSELAMRSDSMMTGVPDPVIAFQHVFQARSRVVILRRLLTSPATFAELLDDLELSVGALRDGLNSLESVGYVGDDSPKSATRKSSKTLFHAVRETVMIDLSETVRYLTV